jgi:hypothetical protein
MRTEKRAHFFRRVPGSLVPLLVVVLLIITNIMIGQSTVAAEPGATTSVRVVKYADGGETVLAEKRVDYVWLERNRPLCGDGVTHYYHQGPVFEGDSWNPEETVNLKDKGAVRGTDIKELCELVGGMAPEDEVMVCAVDGYRLKFAYKNVYTPLIRQGPIVLCWYKGEDAEAGTSYESGYPGNDAYSSALQLVFMAQTQSSEGKFVFGNDDMRVCLPEEKYQHFYEGLPSTNGLSAKWVSEIRIYTGGAPERIEVDDFSPADGVGNRAIPWLPIVVGSLGLILVLWSLFFFVRRKG